MVAEMLRNYDTTSVCAFAISLTLIDVRSSLFCTFLFSFLVFFFLCFLCLRQIFLTNCPLIVIYNYFSAFKHNPRNEKYLVCTTVFHQKDLTTHKINKYSFLWLLCTFFFCFHLFQHDCDHTKILHVYAVFVYVFSMLCFPFFFCLNNRCH